MTNPTSMSEAKTREPTEEQKDRARDVLHELSPWARRTSDQFVTAIAQALAEESSREKARADGLHAAMEKINGIRNSIVGTQSINWSEHIYPLVAALNGAGLVGLSYPEARENVGTLIDRTNAAEARADGLAKELAAARVAYDGEHARWAAGLLRNALVTARADAAEARVASLEKQLIAHSARGCTCADTSPEYCPICADKLQDTEKRLREYLAPSGAPPAQPPAAAPVQEREAVPQKVYVLRWVGPEGSRESIIGVYADGKNACEAMFALPSPEDDDGHAVTMFEVKALAAPLPSAKPQEESAAPAGRCEAPVQATRIMPNGTEPCGNTLPCPAHPGGGK